MKKRRFLTIGTGIATTALFFSQTLLAGASYLTSNGSVTTTHLTEDVTYQARTGASSPRGSQGVYSLSYNLHNPYYDLVLGGNVYGTQTTSSMAAYMNSQAGYDIIGGVNGDHFSFANGIPLGFSMDDGIIVESPVTDTDADGYMFYSLGVTRDGEVVAGYNPTLIASCQKTDGSASISIDRINRTREWWNGAQLCLFTNRYSSSTHEEAGGRELVIQVTSGSVSPQGGPLRGEVVSVVTSGNAAIGANQVVLSGEGDKATALQQYAVGDEIEMNFRFTDENWNKVDFAIGGNYVIVENGQAKTYAYGSSAGAFTAAAQRTAIGIRADGTVVLVATNGRGSGGVGFTANDMSRLMAEDYGCQYAILLDGGGSTTLVTQTSSGSYQVRNTLASSQRAVGNGIFIARLSTPRAVPCASMLPDTIGAVQTVGGNVSAAYRGDQLVLTSTGGGGTVEYTVNRTYNVRQLPYLFLHLSSSVDYNMAFDFVDADTGGSTMAGQGNLTNDWGPSVGVSVGSPIPGGIYNSRRVNFIGCMAWNNRVPANGKITVTKVRIYLAQAGTMTIDNLYMAPGVLNEERGLNLMPRQGITTSPSGVGGSTGTLMPAYQADGSILLTNDGTSWPSVKTVYNTTVDLNATPYLYYDFDGIAAGNHTGVNAILWYNGGNSYLQFSQLVNGDVNDLMSNQSGRVDVRAYLRGKGAFPSDGKLEISYVTISVATWKAGSSAVFHTFRFGAV